MAGRRAKEHLSSDGADVGRRAREESVRVGVLDPGEVDAAAGEDVLAAAVERDQVVKPERKRPFNEIVH